MCSTMKFVALLFVLGLAIVSALPQPSVENSDELDDFIRSSRSEPEIPDDYLKEVFQKIRDYIGKKDLDREKFKELIEKLLPKGSKEADILLEQLRKFGFNGVLNFLDIYEFILKDKCDSHSEPEIPDEYLKEVFQKIRDYIGKKDLDREKFKDLIEKLLPKGSKEADILLEQLRKFGFNGVLNFLDIYEFILKDKCDSHSGPDISDCYLKEVFQKLRDYIDEYDFDREKFKNMIEKLLPKGSKEAEGLLEVLRERGVAGVLNFLNIYEFIAKDECLSQRTENADSREPKKSIIGSVFNYLKTVSEKGKNKIAQLIYRRNDDSSSVESGKTFPGSYIPDIFRRLRDFLKKSDDLEKFKNVVEKLLTKGSTIGRQLLETLKTKGKQVVIDFCNRIMGHTEENFAVDSSRPIVR